MVIKLSRVWAMPSKNTFTIKPVNDLIKKYLYKNIISIDPFANSSSLATITNDIDTQYNTNYHLDALDFLKLFSNQSIDLVFFDPPFSPSQISRSYKKCDKSVNFQTTQNSFWSKLKQEISRVVKKDGVVITCAWNSGGIGKKYGFNIEEILLVNHGSWHNDTIIVVDKKIV